MSHHALAAGGGGHTGRPTTGVPVTVTFVAVLDAGAGTSGVGAGTSEDGIAAEHTRKHSTNVTIILPTDLIDRFFPLSATLSQQDAAKADSETLYKAQDQDGLSQREFD